MNADSLEQTVDIDGLLLERLLDNKWFARLQTISPQEFGRLTPSERRTWANRAERIRKRFEEISRWMARNTEREPDIPGFLRREGAL